MEQEKWAFIGAGLGQFRDVLVCRLFSVSLSWRPKRNSIIFVSTGQQGVGFQSTDLGAAAGSRTMGLGTSMGIGSGLGTSTQGTTGFANLGSTSGGFGTSSGFGTTLGTPARIGTGLGASAFGQTSGTSTGLSFGSSTSTGLGGGLNTGAATPSTFGTQPKFQLQRPPQGNKRGKRR